MFSWIQAIDRAALLWIVRAVRTPALDGVVAAYSMLGNGGLIFIAISLVMLIRSKTRRAGMVALCAMAVGFLCTNVLLKPLVARPRPWVTLPVIIPLVLEQDLFSFPSGHTTAAFAAAIAWRGALHDVRLQWAAIVGAIFMGASRLYVGVHYPVDVLAGAVIGMLSALLCITIAQWHDRCAMKKSEHIK